MRIKESALVLIIFLFSQVIAFAQTKTIKGIVSDDTGPLPGVNIIIKGTTTGTETDFDGNYAIQAKQGDILVFSYVGMDIEERTVGTSNVIDVILKSGNVLEEVVITAMGISKEKKALGYAVTTVDNKDIESKADVDIARILRGKAAGVKITGTGGVSGSGSNIFIRGLSSISGNNQPLFIVDGVPFDASSGSTNKSSASSGAFQSGNVSSRFADIDPNNIESVSVLKGLAATAIYGGEGRNGVIVITTKSGKQSNKKLEVSLNQSFFFNNIVLPDYQNDWGAGFQNAYGAFFSNWGSNFNSQETIPNAFRTMMLNNYGVLPSVLFPDRTDLDAPTLPYRSYEAQKDFFKTGMILNTSVGVTGNFSDKGNINLAYGNVNDESFIPNNKLNRNSFSIGGSYKMLNNITASGKINLVRTNIETPFTDASSGSDVTVSTAGTGGIASIWNILYVPRSVDINQPYQHPITGESLWYRGGNDRMNPRWVLANTKDTDDTDRVFGNYGMLFEANDWINITYKLGFDIQNRLTERMINKGGNDGIHPNGYLQSTSERYSIWDHTVMFNINRDLFKNFNLEGGIGFNSKSEKFNSDGVESRSQIVFGLQNHGNYLNTSSIVEGTTAFSSNVPYKYMSEINNVAALTSWTLGYANYLYLNVTARNEWSSTLEQENRSQFSPGISLSFIPTNAFNALKSQGGLNYLKLRASYGTAPGFPSPYRTRGVLALSPNLFTTLDGTQIIGTSVSNILPNPDLKPELSKEYELGVDATFFKNRLSFEATYYSRNTEDQIFFRSLSPETGYTLTTENVGDVINKGIELNATVTPVKTDKFNLNFTGNFTKNISKVENIVGDQFLYGGIFSVPQNAAINGEPLGVFYGARILKDDEGNYLVNENGYWIQDPENGIIGDPNPDWFASMGTGITWKNFNFNMQWEYQQGGDVYATTIGTLIGRGLVEDTNFDRTQGIILPGIRQATGEPNDIMITATEAYFNNIGVAGIDERQIYDATHIRLREVSFSYDLPDRLIEKTPFGKIGFTLSGQNLWVRAFNTPKSINYDPELNSLGVGNSQGFDYLTSWNSRKIGASIKLTF